MVHNSTIHVNATLDPPPAGKVKYVAANAAYRNGSFSGSGLPYANEQMAFENSPNQGLVDANDGNVSVTLASVPGSYYVNLGTTLIPPCVHFLYIDSVGMKHRKIVHIGSPIPFRLLTYPAMRHDASFYDGRGLPIRSQDEILHASAYRNNYPQTVTVSDFWHQRPPM
jgi:hypothetical protein